MMKMRVGGLGARPVCVTAPCSQLRYLRVRSTELVSIRKPMLSTSPIAWAGVIYESEIAAMYASTNTRTTPTSVGIRHLVAVTASKETDDQSSNSEDHDDDDSRSEWQG